MSIVSSIIPGAIGYTEAIRQLEPSAANILVQNGDITAHVEYSVAVSLRRIADAIDLASRGILLAIEKENLSNG